MSLAEFILTIYSRKIGHKAFLWGIKMILNNIVKKIFQTAYRVDNKPSRTAFGLVCKRSREPVTYRQFGPTWVPFILLLLMSLNSTHASPQITLISPSTDLWTASNNVEFNVNIADPSPAYGFIDWQDSLVGWWRAEGNANDESKSGNHGQFIGDASTTGGKFGQAFTFDGDGDSVDIGDFPEFDFHKTDSFTISTWVNKADNSGTKDILQKGRYFRLFYHEAKRWQFSLGNPDKAKNVYSVGPAPQGKWVHVLVVYNASNQALSMYVDGEHKMTRSLSE